MTNKAIQTKSKPPLKIKKEADEDGVIELRLQNIKNTSEFIEALCVADVDMANCLSKQLMSTQEANGKSDSDINAAYAMYQGIAPKDSVECLLAAQMVAVHNMSLEMAKRAMTEAQTFEGVNANINRVTKLMRTFTAQVETLKKYRTGGKQTIQVQHVNVNEGGQAVVGNVNKGEG